MSAKAENEVGLTSSKCVPYPGNSALSPLPNRRTPNAKTCDSRIASATSCTVRRSEIFLLNSGKRASTTAEITAKIPTVTISSTAVKPALSEYRGDNFVSIQKRDERSQH